MNTGLQDAANLGWKLGCVLRGFASEQQMLDSYEAERMPVGRQLLAFTDRLFLMAASPNKWVIRLRDAVVPAWCRRSLATAGAERWCFDTSHSWPFITGAARLWPRTTAASGIEVRGQACALLTAR